MTADRVPEGQILWRVRYVAGDDMPLPGTSRTEFFLTKRAADVNAYVLTSLGARDVTVRQVCIGNAWAEDAIDGGTEA